MTATATVEICAINKSVRRQARPQISFLDGLRGLSAAYVVVQHAKLFASEGSPPLSSFLRLSTQWMNYGQVAVAVFIVLSGYCLTLPVLSNGMHNRVEIGGFFLRRARRILPPYFAALLLSAVAIAVGFLHGPGFSIDRTDIWSHLLLIHNFIPASAHAIDSPMWSVATEWQIYFFFPLALLPTWRRFGIFACVSLAAVVSIVLHLSLPDDVDESIHPWYLLLFAVGLTAALVTETATTRPSGIDRHAGAIAIAAASVLLIVFFFKAHLGRHLFFVSDTLEGLATATLIIFCQRQRRTNRPGVLLRILQHPWLVWLGYVSYSLYLVHFPVLGFLNQIFIGGGVSTAGRLCLLLTIGCGVSLVAAVGFHLLFERPFLGTRRKNADPVVA